MDKTIIYEEPICYIKNNGHLSEQISIPRGIRQGCPVSGLLFILAVEILVLRIRSSISLKGLPIGNKHIKISQYADDGVFYLNDKDEIGCAINIISNFGNVAGTLLNIGVCSTVVDQATHMRMYASSSPTNEDHHEELI